MKETDVHIVVWRAICARRFFFFFFFFLFIPQGNEIDQQSILKCIFEK